MQDVFNYEGGDYENLGEKLEEQNLKTNNMIGLQVKLATQKNYFWINQVKILPHC